MYKRILFITITLFVSIVHIYAQSVNADLIKLARIYKNFSSFNNDFSAATAQLNAVNSQELSAAKNFIAEAVKPNNKLTTKNFLLKPDSATLKHLYTIRTINWKMHEDTPTDYDAVIDSLNNMQISNYEYLSCYYHMLFNSVGNKNRPFDLSDVNFTLDDYNLADETEKGILFLEAMQILGTYIWGYMNIPNPPNYKEALKYISKYPRFNGVAYYHFSELNFKDFDLTVDKTKPKESYKKYYINKYLNTLLYHTYCLAKKGKTKEQQNVMLSSIMKNEAYYKYSKKPEIFRQMFEKRAE